MAVSIKGLISVSAVPYGDTNNDIYSNDDYEDDSNVNKEENQIYAVPKFESTSINELVNEGGTIRLPCIVDRLGKQEFVRILDAKLICVSWQLTGTTAKKTRETRSSLLVNWQEPYWTFKSEFGELH